MFVVGQGDQLGANETFLRHELNLAGVAKELRRDEDGDVLDMLSAVASCFLSLHVGVDRHLGNAASTDRVDEIDRGGSSLGSNGFDCGF